MLENRKYEIPNRNPQSVRKTDLPVLPEGVRIRYIPRSHGHVRQKLITVVCSLFSLTDFPIHNEYIWINERVCLLVIGLIETIEYAIAQIYFAQNELV